ncbi:Ig-like domain-containing protein [Pontibacter roseus]|uniref:Ig-like domain-containing protein n=1 Tax=Pontibacter roseus TaxID=336989 RepID=UPI000379A5DE|nr:Ig-like domain-containing protein [Pontibacter roseus]
MIKALRALLTFSLSLVFLFACNPDSPDPAPASEIPQLKAIAQKTELVPYEIYKVIVKEKPLKSDTYAAKFGELDVTLKKVNDTLLVGGVPAIAPGTTHLKGTVENSLLDIKLQVLPNQDIPEPIAYLEAFVNATDLSKYKITLDSLVKVGTMSAEQAKSELDAAKDAQAEHIQMIAAASPEDQRIAAAFISANRYHFDKVQASLNALRLASSQSTISDVRAKIGTIKLAIAEIGLMVAGPALIASSVSVFVPGQATLVNYWATAGAVLGARIFENKIIEQKNIIVATALSIFDDAMVAVSNSFGADFQQRIAATEQTFINKVAYKANMTVRLRNLQPNDAFSGEPVLKSFVGLYLGFRQLWQEYMADFGALPDLLPLKEKEVAVDYTKVNVQITENTNVSGGLIKENDIYKVRFSTEELTDQKFKFTYTYTLPDVPAFKQEVYGTLTIPNFKVLKTKGDNQTAAPKEILPDSLIIKVLDGLNKPVEGYQVSWNVVAGGGSVTGNAITNKQGFARAKWTLGTAEIENKVEAVVKDRSGNAIKDGKAVFTAIAKNSFSLKYVLGNNQSASFGETLPNDLIVRLVDHRQLPVKDQKVWWSVTEGGGTVTSTSSFTDQNGEAKVKWKLGPAGMQKMIAFFKDKDNNDVPGSPVTFTASPASYTLHYISGADQTTNAGQRIAQPLKVRVTDQNNNGVRNATIDWEILNTGGGTLSNTTSVTDADGYASTFYTPESVGTKQIRAVGSLIGGKVNNSVTFPIYSKLGYKIIVSGGQPKIFVGHKTGGKPFTFLLTDAENRPIANATLHVNPYGSMPANVIPVNVGQNITYSSANYDLKTDAEGKATIEINIEFIAGDYTFKVDHIQYDANFNSQITENYFNLRADYPFTLVSPILGITTVPNCPENVMELKSSFTNPYNLINVSSSEYVKINSRYAYKDSSGAEKINGNRPLKGNVLELIETQEYPKCPIVKYSFNKSTSTFIMQSGTEYDDNGAVSARYYDFYFEIIQGERIYRSNFIKSTNSLNF